MGNLIRAAAFVLATAASRAESVSFVSAPYEQPGAERTFTITYTAHVDQVPAATAHLRLWLPVPHDSPLQRITALHFSSPPRLTRGRRFGNRFAFWDIAQPRSGATETMTFTCTRRELRTALDRLRHDGVDTASTFADFAKPDRLVVVDARIKRLSDQITAGKEGTLAKARAIYDYVLGHMKYDKSRPGWGRGSTEFACDEGRGNCTDFHSLFISLCRAQGIASAFEIGLYLPYEAGVTKPVGGYHCWAYFRIPGKAWVPVDCSEGWLEPQRRDYFFGGQTDNRVALSTGRDLTLEPAQAGPPLNYFLDPYAEADGQPIKATKSWSYSEPIAVRNRHI